MTPLEQITKRIVDRKQMIEAIQRQLIALAGAVQELEQLKEEIEKEGQDG